MDDATSGSSPVVDMTASMAELNKVIAAAIVAMKVFNEALPDEEEGDPVNRQERRHGKNWKLPKQQEEWRRRRG